MLYEHQRSQLVSAACEIIASRAPHLVVESLPDARWNIRCPNGDLHDHGKQLTWAGLVGFAKALRLTA